ncbi:MAG: SDR family NAD(P)-dependent oxidoreductase [Alphaproteobacteria bacterium]|nr:SDR family NAD(P)-dependent oxidoreductase [Alphaproteobacteria bacterium]
MTDINLTGKVAIVAGGGGGMGRAIALALVEKGAKVAVFDVRQENVDKVVDEAAAIGDSECAIPLVRDITQIDDCMSAVQETIDAFNSADILVNAAGLGMATLKDDYWNDNLKFWNADIDRFNALMNVNWNGAFLLARSAAPHMVEKGWGRIVNVTTSLDTMTTRGYTPYGPSKAALEAATSVWSKDLEGTGVTANVLVPGGPVNTDFIPENAPFDRTKLTQPEVMQAPMCWLASDLSDGVTNMRFVARSWDPDASLEDAIKESGGPCAWPDAGKKAFKPT